MWKLVLIAYNVSIHEEVMDSLNEIGLKNYTRWDRVLGRGEGSGPHLDTHIWPGYNSVMAMAVEEERLKELMEKIIFLKQRFSREGIKAFVLPIEHMV
ncbi:MAG: PG0541 family transporter-associated protein [bacterium]